MGSYPNMRSSNAQNCHMHAWSSLALLSTAASCTNLTPGSLIVILVQARKQPTSQAEVVEYLLSTEAGEMQYETARCRPHLDQTFFAYLDRQIGELDIE